MTNPFSHSKINYHPLQMSGQDEILREYTLAGPDSGRDCRLILDVKTLGLLLDIARSSNTKRVILHGAGINLKVRKSQAGHVYETLHLTSRQPTPEHVSSSLSFEAPVSYARQLIKGFAKK